MANVEQFCNKNQFIITDDGNYTLQSYGNTIAKERAKQEKAFQVFLDAEKGFFYNGIEFADVFNEKIKKDDALFIGQSDECAEVKTPFGTFSTARDGLTAYFYSTTPKKAVLFNRSIYFF